MTDLEKANEYILKPLRSIGIPAIIVGGFMRDQLTGRPWKDIDLIVPYWAHTEAAEALFGKIPSIAPVGDADPLYVHFCLYAQYEDTFYREDWPVKVNLIIWREECEVSMQDAARRVNFGLCQIAWDGETVFKTAAFDEDFAKERFTLMRTDMGLEGSMNHWLRLQDKYRGWPMYPAAYLHDPEQVGPASTDFDF
jgi:hypothetical protein